MSEKKVTEQRNGSGGITRTTSQRFSDGAGKSTTSQGSRDAAGIFSGRIVSETRTDKNGNSTTKHR